MFSSKETIPLILKKNQHAVITTFLNPISFYGFLAMPDRYSFDYIFSDGLLITKLHNLFLPSMKIERVSFDFSSIAHNIFKYAETKNQKIFLIGGKDNEVIEANRKLLTLYPKLNMSFRHGYFECDAEKSFLMQDLEKIKPDIIISGMGYPNQENFLIQCKKNLNFSFIGFTCGGFISQTALKTDYYHPIIKKLGLRWLQRAYLHHHVRQRLLKNYPIFLFKYLKDLSFKREKTYL